MIILGLRSKHDSAAALLVNGELVAAAAEERFRRRKHYFGFPEQAVRYVLSAAGIRPDEVDIVACDGLTLRETLIRLLRQARRAWTPRLYAELLQKALDRYVRRAVDVQRKERDGLHEVGVHAPRFIVQHHHGHAAYAYYVAGAPDSTIIALDGRGHYVSGEIYTGCDGKMERLAQIPAEGGSLGHFYSAVTDALGFDVGDGEGKTMGLACYGDPRPALGDLEQYAPAIRGLQSAKRGEWRIATDVIDDRLYSHYEEGATLRLLIDRYGEANVAAATQEILERRLVQLVRNAIAASGQRLLIGSGGVFLNVKASKVLIEQGVVDSIIVPPGPGDDGLPAGYALAAHAALVRDEPPRPLRSAYLGPCFTEQEIRDCLAGYADVLVERLGLEALPEATADLLAQGQVVGWFQGRMEWGPRALGNRSVLADPRDPAMRDRINHRLKKRDWFMPFAPSVLREYCEECFSHYRDSPYMNLAFAAMPPYDTMVPAVVHVDNTARPQAVDRQTNPLYYDVIDAFRRRTGIPMVLNTSFNRHGLPIVCAPKDATAHLRWGCVDVLIIGPFVARRAAEPVDYPG